MQECKNYYWHNTHREHQLVLRLTRRNIDPFVHQHYLYYYHSFLAIECGWGKLQNKRAQRKCGARKPLKCQTLVTRTNIHTSSHLVECVYVSLSEAVAVAVPPVILGDSQAMEMRRNRENWDDLINNSPFVFHDEAHANESTSVGSISISISTGTYHVWPINKHMAGS